MPYIPYIVMAFGAIITLMGVFLFSRRGTRGKNVVKMFGFEFQLTGSSLIIFVLGCLIFLAPIIYGDKRPFKDIRGLGEAPRKVPEGAGAVVSGKPPPVPDNYTVLFKKLIAINTHCITDQVGITLNNSDPITLGDKSYLGSNEEIELSTQRSFKHSIDVFVYIRECGEKLSIGSTKAITRNDYRRGDQSLQFSLGDGLYELVYEIQ